MKYKIWFAAAFWVVLMAISCNNDDISFDTPSQNLRFSRDTVFCDTVYNQVRSETYVVKVYNDENKDIMIPKIQLAGGSSSLYRINVDGKSGTEFTNVPLRKKDSLYIFVEIAPVANAPEAIAEDEINFTSNVGTQHVTLFSVVQDAEFFIKSDTNPNILSENTSWTNEKAKIIFGDLTVAEGKELNIQQGTKVYFFKNSGMKISKNAELNINGSLGTEVIFRGDRSDTRYDTLPKNWNGIVLEEGSKLNMKYARVFGGTKGFSLYSSTADIENSIIHTFEEYGIYSVASDITAKNMVMNNCGEADLGIFKGGIVNLTHCTLANYWELNSMLPALGIFASDKWTNDDGQTEEGSLILNVYNSIVYGHSENMVELETTSGALFENCLLKYGAKSSYNTINSIKNEDPKFLDYFTHKMNLRVADDSPAKEKGNSSYANQVPYDIVGKDRTTFPTIGAYQWF
ncbi:MAG: hypothetical protein QM564_02805 [Bergeyella sp.]